MTETTFTTPTDTEVKLERTFDAPLAKVYLATTDAQYIPHWWGPGRLTTTIEVHDFRPGGLWRYIQKDIDGTEYAFNGEFKKISPTRVVQTFEYEGTKGHILLQTMEFDEKDNQTTVTVTAQFENKADRDSMIEAGMESGQREGIDRLAELLKTL